MEASTRSASEQVEAEIAELIDQEAFEPAAEFTQQALIKAMTELPEVVTKMPDGPEKAKAAAEYRKMIGLSFVAMCEVEEAFLAGKTDEVAEIVTKLKELKKAGHDKFMEEEE